LQQALASFIPTSFRRLRIDDIKRARDTGHFAACFLFVLSVLSYPVGLLQHWWSRGGLEARDKWRIDVWIVTWAIANVVVLFFLLSRQPLFIIFPIARMVDLLYVLVRLPLLGRRVYRRGRALLFLLVHYFEVTTIFGSIYIFLQQTKGAPIFLVQGQPGCLSPAQAFYFSVSTAATVGYGDITPNLKADLSWAQPSTFIALEVFCIIIIIVLDVAHIFSKLDSTESNPG